MHRVSWTAAGGRQTCLTSDGVWVPPARLREALGGFALALLSRHALWLEAGGPRSLAPGVAVSARGASLLWEPSSVAALAPENTERGETAPPRSTSMLLSAWNGHNLTIGPAPLLAGRHAACDLCLDDRQVSQFHCALVGVGDAVRLVDLASTNGTYLDGVRVHQATVARRAALRLGRARLVLAPAEAVVAPSPARSAAMQALLERVERVAPTRAPVLIQGESGVGKDLVARQLHHLSGRRGPLVVLNAATLGSALAGSELFGHVRGAFTGADRDHAGAFLRAHEGTLFLDEIAELPLPVQAELLRAAETGRVRRLGEGHETPVDVRLVAATHRDLTARVRSGEFREDLYHRLCVVPLTVPPLRDRLEDLDAITDAFLGAQEVPLTLSRAARHKLRGHHFSGNVRELLNALQRACTFARADVIEAHDIVFSPPLAREGDSLHDVIQERVLAAYAQSRSVAVTARSLGLRRSVVHRVLQEERRGARGEFLAGDGGG